MLFQIGELFKLKGDEKMKITVEKALESNNRTYNKWNINYMDKE